MDTPSSDGAPTTVPRWLHRFCRMLLKWKVFPFLWMAIFITRFFDIVSSSLYQPRGTFPPLDFGQVLDWVGQRPLLLLVFLVTVVMYIPVRILGREQSLPVISPQERMHLVDKLSSYYADTKEQPLPGAAWLEPGLVSKPDAVQSLAPPHQSSRPSGQVHLLLNKEIFQAYQDAGCELLILGEPGTGKSHGIRNEL